MIVLFHESKRFVENGNGVAVGQPNAEELYLRPGDDMVIAFEGLMALRTRIVAPG